MMGAEKGDLIMSENQDTKKVLLLALSGFELLEFSAFADVLGWAKLEGGLAVEYDTAGFAREVRSTTTRWRSPADSRSTAITRKLTDRIRQV